MSKVYVVNCKGCIWYKFMNSKSEGEPWFTSGVTAIEKEHLCKYPENEHWIDGNAVNTFNTFGTERIVRESWKGTPGKWLDKQGEAVKIAPDEEGKEYKLEPVAHTNKELEHSATWIELMDGHRLKESALWVECRTFASKRKYKVPDSVRADDGQVVKPSDDYCPKCRIRLPVSGECDNCYVPPRKPKPEQK